MLWGIGMVAGELSIGTRVRVSENCSKEHLRGLPGEVMAIYRRGEHTAIHVRFTDGLWHLLWAKDIERLLQ